MNCPSASMFEAMKWETVNFLEFLLKKNLSHYSYIYKDSN